MILAILANACGRQNAADFFDVAVYSPSEAEGFEIAGAEGCESTVIRVKTAWQDSGKPVENADIEIISKGETVKIIDGPFATFSGTIEEINPERNKLRVVVGVFGRATPVEVDLLQVEKIM